MALTWGPLQTIAEDAPRFPYAHWWLDDRLGARRSVADRVLVLNGENPRLSSIGVRRGLAARVAGIFEEVGADIAAIPAGLPDEAVNEARTEGPQVALDVDLRPGDAIVAAIDDGTWFAHQRLRGPDGSARVVWAWDQGAAVAGPSDLPFGREFDRQAIDRLIAAHTHDGELDEEGLYAAAGLIDRGRPSPRPSFHRFSHGAAVADILAGGAPDDAEAQRLHMLMVSLPQRVTHDTSGAFIAVFALIALDAILDRARAIIESNRGMRRPTFATPIVINISYGLTAGPKDGTGLLERYIEKRLAAWTMPDAPVSIVAPIGNHRMSRSRARLSRPADSRSLQWRLPPDDVTPSFLEIWGRRRTRPASPTFTVSLAEPGATETPPAPRPAAFGAFADILDGGERVIGRAYFDWWPENAANPDATGREWLTLVMRPTRPEAPGDSFIAPGLWRLRVTRLGRLSSWPLDLFVQRDDSLPGYPRRGRQSSLHDGVYAHVDAAGRALLADPEAPGPVRREGTLNALCAGPAVVLVGGTDTDGRRAAYSALGFDNDRFRRSGPDFYGPAEGKASFPLVTAAGAASGSRVGVAGTSFAAPFLARRIALGLVAVDT
jgi:hypothetical protein